MTRLAFMASIHTEVVIAADADDVWRVVGDWANGPADMARGHVTSCRAEGPTRVVTFADGFIARERLVARDDDARRIAYSVVGGTVRPDHDNAVMQTVADGPGRCRFVWSRDVLPDDLVDSLRAGMEHAAAIIKRTFED